MKPERLEGAFKCSKCGSLDTTSLSIKDNSRIVWCCCGHIEVIITFGMSVNVERG